VTCMEATKLAYVEAGKAVLQKMALKSAKPDDLLISSRFSGISRGTESLVFNGKVPKGEWERMRCPHQIGEFSFPITYGYSLVGIVEEAGPNTQIDIGNRVFCLHPHQDRALACAKFTHVIPTSLPLERAVLAPNMETALNAVWDGKTETGMTALVIGAGVVGLLIAHALRCESGIEPLVVDVDGDKRHISNLLGFRFSTAQELNVSADKFDRVFHTSASEQGLTAALNHAAFEGRIVEVSWYGDREPKVPLGGAFHSQRLTLVSSQVAHVARPVRHKINHSQRMDRVMELLKDPRLDNLLEPAIPFKKLPQALPTILGSSSKALCQLVSYT